jgi:hypothetical protein
MNIRTLASVSLTTVAFLISGCGAAPNDPNDDPHAAVGSNAPKAPTPLQAESPPAGHVSRTVVTRQADGTLATHTDEITVAEVQEMIAARQAAEAEARSGAKPTSTPERTLVGTCAPTDFWLMDTNWNIICATSDGGPPSRLYIPFLTTGRFGQVSIYFPGKDFGFLSSTLVGSGCTDLFVANQGGTVEKTCPGAVWLALGWWPIQ